MKLKLTCIQFLALYNLFKQMVGENQVVPKSMEARLLLSILASIYKKLYVRAVEKKKKYTVTLDDQEALAFWLFFSKYSHFLLPAGAVFEANLINTINNSIHQKFS